MQFHMNLERTHMTDWIIQFNFAFVDYDAVACCQALSNLLAGDCAEQTAAFA
ncbi:hypothetical protein D3C73_1554880 [compost metagenome]